MSYVPYKAGTLLIPTGGTNHLFIVITDNGPNGEHLLVNVTSIKAGIKHDDTCLVHVGDHPFIKHPSYAEYRRAEVASAAHISKMVQGFVYKPSDDASATLVQMLRDGIEDSPYVKGRILNYFKKYG